MVLLYYARPRSHACEQEDERARFYKALRGLGFPFDVFIIGSERFEETKNIFGGIAYPANKYGRVIYEAA